MTSGITHGKPLISLNALILLITNLVAIILGAAIVFRMLNVHISLHGFGMPVVRVFPILSARQFAPEHQDSNK